MRSFLGKILAVKRKILTAKTPKNNFSSAFMACYGIQILLMPAYIRGFYGLWPALEPLQAHASQAIILHAIVAGLGYGLIFLIGCAAGLITLGRSAGRGPGWLAFLEGFLRLHPRLLIAGMVIYLLMIAHDVIILITPWPWALGLLALLAALLWAGLWYGLQQGMMVLDACFRQAKPLRAIALSFGFVLMGVLLFRMPLWVYGGV